MSRKIQTSLSALVDRGGGITSGRHVVLCLEVCFQRHLQDVTGVDLGGGACPFSGLVLGRVVLFAVIVSGLAFFSLAGLDY